MQVVIIGSGNVATVMGGKIVAAGHIVSQVVGRRPEAVADLARQWDTGYTTEWTEVRRDADLYLVAISDKVVPGLSAMLQLPGRLVVHTAGALPLQVLRDVSDRCGVLYPLQSLRREIRPFPEFPLLVDAADPDDLARIESLAQTISRQVQRADDAYRLKCHVAAVMVNNFTNFLYTLAHDLCTREGIDFSLLQPIIRETSTRLEHYTPGEVQTGPAIRGDGETMRRHLELLADYPQLIALYQLFSAEIASYYRN